MAIWVGAGGALHDSDGDGAADPNSVATNAATTATTAAQQATDAAAAAAAAASAQPAAPIAADTSADAAADAADPATPDPGDSSPSAPDPSPQSPQQPHPHKHKHHKHHGRRKTSAKGRSQPAAGTSRANVINGPLTAQQQQQLANRKAQGIVSGDYSTGWGFDEWESDDPYAFDFGEPEDDGHDIFVTGGRAYWMPFSDEALVDPYAFYNPYEYDYPGEGMYYVGDLDSALDSALSSASSSADSAAASTSSSASSLGSSAFGSDSGGSDFGSMFGTIATQVSKAAIPLLAQAASSAMKGNSNASAQQTPQSVLNSVMQKPASSPGATPGSPSPFATPQTTYTKSPMPMAKVPPPKKPVADTVAATFGGPTTAQRATHAARIGRSESSPRGALMNNIYALAQRYRLT